MTEDLAKLPPPLRLVALQLHAWKLVGDSRVKREETCRGGLSVGSDGN
jgi:hypothetical protein